ncbi:MAG: ATPase domain-containing protein [Nitrososphaera sp.]
MDGKVSTGVVELDASFDGGYPEGSLLLVGGGPGAGKMVFACHFLHEGAMRGEKVAYVSLVESEKSFRTNAARMGFDFGDNLAFLEFFTGTAGAVASVLDAIMAAVQAVRPKRVVIDSISSISDSVRDEGEMRRILHNVLAKTMRQSGITAMLVAEAPFGALGTGEPSAEFVCDGVIILRQRINGDDNEEEGQGHQFAGSMEVVKMRGCAIRRKAISYTIGEKGIATASPIVREKGSRRSGVLN